VVYFDTADPMVMPGETISVSIFSTVETDSIRMDRTRHAFTARLGWIDVEKKTLKDLFFQYRFDILLGMRLSGVAEQGYAMLYGKSQLILQLESLAA